MTTPWGHHRGHRRRRPCASYIKAAGKGVLKVMSQDGHLHRRVLHRRPDLRGHRAEPRAGRRVLHRHPSPPGRHRPVDDRRGGGRAATPTPTRPRDRAVAPQPWRRRRVPVAPRGRAPPVQPRDGVQAAALDPQRAATTSSRQYTQLVDDQSERLATLRGLFRFARRRTRPPCPRGGGAGQRDRQALLHRRHELRLHQPGGPRDAGHRHEPARRQVQHRRGRRGPGAVHRPTRTATPALGDQAGGLRPVRRDQRVPGQRRRHPDQDGPGRQARRGRPAAGAQGLPVDRQHPALDARRGADLARRRTTTSTRSRTWRS